MRSCLARFAVALPSSFALLLVAQVGLTPAVAAAAQGTPPAADDQAKMKADMDAMMKLAQPGEHHKRLDSLAGKWKVTGKAWMTPGQPPTEFSGTMESSWLLGGRYRHSVHKSTFFGMPFEGQAIDGYDNATHEYFSTWIDTMGTGVILFRGTCDDPCKVLTEVGDEFDPMAGKMVKSKQVTTFVDPDNYRFEMYMVGGAPDGKDVKVMELAGTRAK